MRLTYEVKDYIRNQLNKRIAEPVQKVLMEELRNDAKEFADSVKFELNAVLQDAAKRFVELHPEAEGIEFIVRRYSTGTDVEVELENTTLCKELRQATTLRTEHIETLNAMAQIDATHCKTSIELDEVITKLIER